MRALPSSHIEDAITAYFDAISRRQLEQWIALFAPDAICHDPVGSPPAEGRDGLEEVWRVLTSAFSTMTMQPDDIFYASSGAAVKWTAEGTGVNERSIEFEGISVFEIAEDGKIQTVMSYWDAAEMMIRLAGEGDISPLH